MSSARHEQPSESAAPSTLIREVEVEGRIVDVRLQRGNVHELGDSLTPRRGEEVVTAGGGALIPGLHDHHLHLLAMAAARASVKVGPPEVVTSGELASALRLGDRRLPAGAWLRAVGFHESVEPSMDRYWLDRVVRDRPVRVQHRSGRQWILNSLAVVMCGLVSRPDRSFPGVERDRLGVPTGRLTGNDDQFRGVWSSSDDLGPLVRESSMELASYGVTGITDATPYDEGKDIRPLVEALRNGLVLQHLVVMGSAALDPQPEDVDPAVLGPVKIVIADDAEFSLEEVVSQVRLARQQNRNVAVHCVTRIALVLCLAALEEVGARPGDRIEHGAVVDHDLTARLAGLGLVVVTQPNFIRERGDRYLEDVDPIDRDHLYPCGRLIRAGVGVAGSTDAPFGHPDPWRAMTAAVQRTSDSGRPLGLDERVSAERAMSLFSGRPDAPAGPARRVSTGGVADLCLLHVPLAHALKDLQAAHVRVTWVRGRQVWPG